MAGRATASWSRTQAGPNPIKNDFRLSPGGYYVDGWLCENDQPLFYRAGPAQPYLHEPPALENGRRYLAYLDVWERHVSSAEADGPIEIQRRQPTLLRELALGGPDTATRAQVIWQVKVSDRILRPTGDPITIPETVPAGDWPKWVRDQWNDWVENWQPRLRGSLKVETRKGAPDDEKNPCVIPPESRYRGLENQLYRVEIHRGGPARTDQSAQAGATFKWSRENGSTVAAIALQGKNATLTEWWRDDRFGFAEGDYVEVVNDTAHGATDTLRRVTAIDHDALTVTLDDAPPGTWDPSTHPVMRRWDHRQRASTDPGAPTLADDNALYVAEGKWLTLEDGIQIWFDESDSVAHSYRTGDYWLIPARTGIGDVLWPKQGPSSRRSRALPTGSNTTMPPWPSSNAGADGTVDLVADLRRQFKPLAEP